MKPPSQRSTILIGGAVFFAAVAAAWLVGSPDQPVEVAAVEATRRPQRAPAAEPKAAAISLVPAPRAPTPEDATTVVDIFLSLIHI